MASPLLGPLSANPSSGIAVMVGRTETPGLRPGQVDRCVEQGCEPRVLYAQNSAVPLAGRGKTRASSSFQGHSTATLGTQPCSYRALGPISARVGSHLCLRGSSLLSRRSQEVCPPGRSTAFMLSGFTGFHCPSRPKRSIIQRQISIKCLHPPMQQITIFCTDYLVVVVVVVVLR